MATNQLNALSKYQHDNRNTENLILELMAERPEGFCMSFKDFRRESFSRGLYAGNSGSQTAAYIRRMKDYMRLVHHIEIREAGIILGSSMAMSFRYIEPDEQVFYKEQPCQ